MLFDYKNETLPKNELRTLQLEKLINQLERVYHTVPFYQKKFDALGIKSENIRTLSDIVNLPFTEKQDLRDNYPYGLFAVPHDHIVRLHASSGTTGKATVVGYTKRDVGNWAKLMARGLAAAGASRLDIVHNAYGYGLFTGGLGMHYGTEQLGATIVPISGGGTRRQIMLMKDFKCSVLCSTPSYCLQLYEAMQEAGLTPSDLHLKIGIFGAEPWSEQMRQDIEKKLNITAINIYGLSEIMGPGVAVECKEAQNGLHIWEDHFLAEIIDPETGEVLPDGEQGELVITTLQKEALPLIRYRTKDITAINSVPCRCGRTHRRIEQLAGRSDDMLIIRGVNVFPIQIENILLECQGTTPHYQLILTRKGALDELEIQIEVGSDLFSDKIKQLQQLETNIKKNIKEFLGITAKVKLVEPFSIKRESGKTKRIIDLRTV